LRDLAGRTAVITGVSRIIGAYVARALADEGMRLVLAARTASEIEAVAAEVRQRGGQAVALPPDVSYVSALAGLVAAARREYGTIDVVVHGAGTVEIAPYHTLEVEQIEAVVRVNLTAAMVLTRLVLPKMVARGSGHVVSIASLAGKLGLASVETYCTTKAGLIAFTASVRAAYRRQGVSATAVCPGFVRSAGMYHQMQQETGVPTPPLFGTSPPTKVAEAVVRGIKQDLPEVIVSPLPVRPLLALQALFPRVIGAVLPRIGGDIFARAGRAYAQRAEPARR
jgi:short-subunit dehydrogenase